MPMYLKYELRQVTQRKDGAVYKTKILGHHWFQAGKGPECYVKIVLPGIGDDLMYVATLDSVIDSRCPKGTP